MFNAVFGPRLQLIERPAILATPMTGMLSLPRLASFCRREKFSCGQVTGGSQKNQGI